MPPSKFRVGGGYTAFVFAGQPLIYCDVLAEVGPQPVAAPEEVQPLDSKHPIEIAFANAHRAGSLTLTLREEWDRDVWEQLPGFEGATDVVEVFERNINNGSITCQKIIRMPGGRRRGLVYHNAVVTRIDDSETINIQSMTIGKTVTIMYTHKTRL